MTARRAPGEEGGGGGAPDADACVARPGGRLAVLVVDDSAVSAKLLVAKLAAAGHATELAENGRVALALLRDRAEEFDLVVRREALRNLARGRGAHSTRARSAPLRSPLLPKRYSHAGHGRR